ncbi:hypothetical protein RHECNPAF_1700098 [Rhizobium etli CNPAF512]|nr:hypothetical protein RHECNPAF_1700098 [Rhizobium etli CNPAF512]
MRGNNGICAGGALLAVRRGRHGSSDQLIGGNAIAIGRNGQAGEIRPPCRRRPGEDIFSSKSSFVTHRES